MRVPFDDLRGELLRALLKMGFGHERAELCARLFAETTRDGVYTHGLNRFSRFVEMVHNGSIDVHAHPVRVSSAGALERWDGRRGPGNLNAYACMERALALAWEHGLGCVALGNTNHWMRGGSYGWQAAEAGCIAVCWTNTLPNVPAWGGTDPRIGNNPLVIAVPRAAGHVVLDMATSQFSYGQLAAYRARGEQLPVAGGYDSAGELTRDAAAIEASQRALPIGYWKGSGLAMMLDMVAATLSGGLATHQIPADALREAGLSQMFIAMDAKRLGASSEIADEIVAFVQASAPVQAGKAVRYPGEQTVKLREENLRLGVPVEEAAWQQLLGM